MKFMTNAKRTRCPVKRDVVNVALVGAGGMGEAVIHNLKPFPDVRIVAVADPAASYTDWGYYKRPLGRLPVKQRLEEYYRQSDPSYVCAAYADFREMLDKEDIDAIVCATPDFSHASQRLKVNKLRCTESGKEKPFSTCTRPCRTVKQRQWRYSARIHKWVTPSSQLR